MATNNLCAFLLDRFFGTVIRWTPPWSSIATSAPTGTCWTSTHTSLIIPVHLRLVSFSIILDVIKEPIIWILFVYTECSKFTSLSNNFWWFPWRSYSLLAPLIHSTFVPSHQIQWWWLIIVNRIINIPYVFSSRCPKSNFLFLVLISPWRCFNIWVNFLFLSC